MHSPPGFVLADKLNVNGMNWNDLRNFQFCTGAGNLSLI
jgi:hypothetical protein